MSAIEEPFDWSLEEPIAVVAKRTDKRLAEFAAAGKVPWEERAERIKEQFPTVDKLDWTAALEYDQDLFARILRDILKLEQAVSGRPGPRPSLDMKPAIRRMQQLWGKDFALLPFPQALKALAGNRSMRHLSNKTTLDKSHLNRLLLGQRQPDGYDMRMCAQAFGKHPSYFLEWRLLYIVAAIVRRLEWSPETSVGIFRKLDYQRKLVQDP